MFDKKAKTIDEQIDLLKSRGLGVTNRDFAYHHLSHISYYRLGEYWYSFRSDTVKHKFHEEYTFEDVIELYKFDKKLRSVVFSVIEQVEISLRTKLIYHLSHEFDPWWFQKLELYTDTAAAIKSLENLREQLERSKDVTIKSHRKKYKDDKCLPPAWKSLEQTSLGMLSKLYGNLKPSVDSKDLIAKEYGAVNHTYLPSWLQALTQIRNYCAHHSRLWNRKLPATVKLLNRPPDPWIQDSESVPKPHEFQKLYIHLCITKYLLNRIRPKNNLTRKLIKLFDDYPIVKPRQLGFKANWLDEPLWMN